jgi:hypothetical protein
MLKKSHLVNPSKKFHLTDNIDLVNRVNCSKWKF